MVAAPKLAGALLLLAGLIGIEVLITDRILWAAAPIHAYVLIVFASGNLALGGLTLSRPSKQILIVGLVWPVLQLLAIVGDIILVAPFAAGREDFTSESFGRYLLANPERADVPAMIVLLALAAAFYYAARRRPAP
jgi:hypothetical protein